MHTTMELLIYKFKKEKDNATKMEKKAFTLTRGLDAYLDFLKASSYCYISAVMFSVWWVAEAWHSRLMYMEGSCYVAIADIEGCCCVAASNEEESWKDLVVLQQLM
jgi:hypothetical protein